ncbi:hypothetical protein [Pseudomonas coleopterorum]|uniref:hypothetical protein n=1 Tax=Pseudomonas coleopterorum TaxID=1605838 RepID=UPI00177C4007|nr:hypothetical protein [Pseudomonas coleopterorum]MBD8483917.1 hypothetical protein [Pseudomonas coleopterorum]
MNQRVGTIDLTPTWGEIGNIYTRLATSNEQKALEAMHGEAARAFAAAEALQQIQAQLPDDLREIACRIMAVELAKQGITPEQTTDSE